MIYFLSKILLNRLKTPQFVCLTYCLYLSSRNRILNQHPDKGAGKEIPGEVNKSTGYYNDMRVKRYDPIGFNVGYREWVEQPE